MLSVATWGFLATLLTTNVQAIAYPDAYCADACNTALGEVVFNGTQDQGYYLTSCDTPIYYTSLYYCATVYCSSHEIKSGLDYLNDTCLRNSNYSLPSYESVMGAAVIDANSLANITRIPAGLTDPINETSIPDESYFNLGYETGYAFNNNIYVSWDFGFACLGFWGLVLLIGIVNRAIVVINQHRSGQDPSNMAVSRPLLMPKGISIWTRRNLIIPATFGGRVQQAFGGWCTIPSRLETFLLVAYILLNFVFCFPGYYIFAKNLYWTDTRMQVARYVADRTGVLSVANFPLIWLFAMRNDPFLWLTGWSFASYNRFHRWVARISTVQAIVHSLAYSAYSWLQQDGDYESSWKEEYWYTGEIATIAMSLLLIASAYWLRQRLYDLFLVLHIVLAIITLVGLFYHLKIYSGEYNGWIWPCVAFWCFDRVLRYGRIILNSVAPRLWGKKLTAIATYDAKADIVRLDVTEYLPNKGVAPGHYYYVYEPASLRGWESHPLTLCTWVRSDSAQGAPATTFAEKKATSDEQQHSDASSSTFSSNGAACGNGLNHSFIIRPYQGFTGRLREKIFKTHLEAQSTKMTVLLEGPYGDTIHLQGFSDVLILAGGGGITAAISHSTALLQGSDCKTRIRIVWAVRQISLVEDVCRHELSAIVGHPRVRMDIHHTPDEPVVKVLNDTVKTTDIPYVVHDGRPDVRTVLSETRAESTSSLAFVSCGTPAMADACRQAVVDELAVDGVDVEFINDSMGW